MTVGATATAAYRVYEIAADDLVLTVGAGGDTPARILSLAASPSPSVLRPHPIVEVFTARERHERMTLGYVGSTVGARLRVVDVRRRASRIEVEQRDAGTGLVVETTLDVGAGGVRVHHVARNTSDVPLVLFALPTLSVRTMAEPADLVLATGRSEWLGEGRWSEQRVAALLPELGFAAVAQPDRTGFGQSSSGGWSTGAELPVGVLAVPDGPGIGWQIESSAGWQWSLSRGGGGVVLSAGGPTDREHHAPVRLQPGESMATVPATLVVGTAGRDDMFARLTRARRALRDERLAGRAVERALPVIYNDYMNTLMGQPTTEALLPLIAAAAGVGAEYFCIDAGWFTDSVDYWGEVGAWQDAPSRFTGGLGAVIDEIRAAGMRPGLWIEPESVGLDSPVADALPPEAFFQRFGEPVIEQRRKHLDLRHPAARAHLDAVVDRLVGEHGIDYLKLDYNIEPGTGTDIGGLAPGHGLLEHTRALSDWLVGVQLRHPDVLVENCASGAMRSDYHLLAVTHLQSTSDQQDALRYSAIAASAPATVLPEQAGNWAYPAASMDAGELAVTLVSGLSGRLYLAGFLDRLDAMALETVREAVALAKLHRAHLAETEPFWPTGLPAWDDDVLSLGQRLRDGSALIYVWSRGAAASLVVDGAAVQVFPSGRRWGLRSDAATTTITVPPGPDAAVFRVHAPRQPSVTD